MEKISRIFVYKVIHFKFTFVYSRTLAGSRENHLLQRVPTKFNSGAYKFKLKAQPFQIQRYGVRQRGRSGSLDWFSQCWCWLQRKSRTLLNCYRDSESQLFESNILEYPQRHGLLTMRVSLLLNTNTVIIGLQTMDWYMVRKEKTTQNSKKINIWKKWPLP